MKFTSLLVILPENWEIPSGKSETRKPLTEEQVKAE